MSDNNVNNSNNVILPGLSLSDMRQQILPKNLLNSKGAIYTCDGNNNILILPCQSKDGYILVSDVTTESGSGLKYSNSISGNFITNDCQVSPSALINHRDTHRIIVKDNTGINWSLLTGDFITSSSLSGSKFKELMMSNNYGGLFSFTGVTLENNSNNNSYFIPSLVKHSSYKNEIISKNLGKEAVTYLLSGNNHCLTIEENYLDGDFYNFSLTRISQSYSTSLTYSSLNGSASFPGDPTQLYCDVILKVPNTSSSMIDVITTHNVSFSKSTGSVDLQLDTNSSSYIDSAITSELNCILIVKIKNNAGDNPGNIIQQYRAVVKLTSAN